MLTGRRHGPIRIRRSGLLALCICAAGAATAAAQQVGPPWRVPPDTSSTARPLRLGLTRLPPLIAIDFGIRSAWAPVTPVPFRDYVREWVSFVNARLESERRLPGMRSVVRPEEELAPPTDTVQFLPLLPVMDTVEGVLPGALSRYADLDMRVVGTGEMGGSWTRFEPCDPSVQFNCNPGLFPQLKPDLQMGIRVAGTVSDRIHVNVDYDQAREQTFDANQIQVYYEGLPNEILQRVEVGDVQFRIPSSRYLTQGIPAGNFGFMAEGQLGPLDFQTVWAQQRGDLTTREFRLGGGGREGVVQDDQIVLDDADYVKSQFFFLVHPDSLVGTPHVDALALLPTDAPAGLRPEQGGTIQLYRDERIPPISGQQQVDLFLADAVSEDRTLRHSGQFRRLEPDQDYIVHLSGLWIMLRSPLRQDEALAVAYVTESGDTIGQPNAEQSPAGVTPELRLLRSPVANHQPGRPTWDFEMHQVYRLNSGTGVDLSSIDLNVSLGDLAGGRTFREGPGGQVTFLKLFGLDEDAPTDRVDEAQLFQPAALLGGAPGSARITGTFLILPTLEPFRAPPSVPSANLSAAEALALLGADANATIYEDTDPVTRESGGRFRLNFSYRVQVEGLASSFSLGQFGIREGSERVRLGDRVLERNVDYTIDYELGQLTLTDAQALFGANPDAQLTVDLEQKSIFDVAPTSLFGLNARYNLGELGALSFVTLYQSEKTLYTRPQLGTEPAGVFLGGASLDLEFGGEWIDRMLGRIPGLRLEGESRFNLTGEMAFSLPNPNRRGQAWVDDFEGTDEVGLSPRRRDWKLGSQPETTVGDGGVLPAVTDASTAARLVWQHDISAGGVITGSLVPQRDIDRQIIVVGNPVPEPVMWLTFGDEGVAPGERVWRSMTAVLSTTGRDLTRSEFFEFYASAGGTEPLALVFDFGSVSEDAMYVDSAGRTSGAYESDGRPWGRGVFDEEARLAEREVWGLDKDARGLWDQPCEAEGIKAYGLGDERSNCTRNNGIPDTEDLDGNGILDANDGAYFRYVVELDESSPYLVRDTAATGTGFRLYRVPLRSGTPVNGASDGTWRFIKHVRMTVTGEPGGIRKNISLARMRIVGSRWTKRDVHGILDGVAGVGAGAGAEVTELRVGPVSRLTDGNEYSPPPGVTDQLQDPTAQFAGAGVEVNEKAQRIAYDGLLPGERAEVFFRFPQQPRSFLSYRQIRLWAVPKRGDWGPGGSERLLLKIGTDPRNFYLFQTPLRTAVGDGAVVPGDWLPEITIDFQNWLDLRAEAEERLLLSRPVGVLQDTVWSADSTYAIVLEDRARAPNLASVREVSFAVYNAGAGAVDGEVWINELRLDQAFTEPGGAGNASFSFNGGDFISGNVAFARQGAVFRQLNQDASYVSTGDLSMNTRAQLGKVFPAAWGLDIPINVSHTSSAATPQFLERSDVLAEDLTGLRETGGGTTSFGIRVSKRTPSANPWVGAIIDGTTLTFGYDAARTNTVTTRNASDGLRGGIQYERDIRALDFDFIPGFVESALRALTPARVENSDFFRGLVGARLRWTPQRIGFGSNYAKRESEAYRYTTILEDTSDLSVRPIESPRRGLDNNAEVNFQPFQAVTASLGVRSVRDLLDPERATQEPLQLGALRAARSEFAGKDIGWEVNRSLTSNFSFRPTIAQWLRPTYMWTNRYGTDRSPSYLDLFEEDGDTTAAMQRRFGSNRQISRQLDFQPAAMIRGLGPTADSATGVRGALYATLRALQVVNVTWNSTLASQFERESFQPGTGYRLGFGDLASFRAIGADTAVSASKRDDVRLRSTFNLPLGSRLNINYTQSSTEGFDVRGGKRTQDQRTWPSLSYRVSGLPIPGFMSGMVLAASLELGFERIERESVLGSRSQQIRGGTDNRIPISLGLTLPGGIFTQYTGSLTRGTTVDPTGDGETDGTRHNFTLSGSLQPPGFLQPRISQPLVTRLVFSQDTQRRCRFQPGVENGDCTAFVDTSNRTASLTVDTNLNDLTVGFRINWNNRQNRVGTRTGSSQFQLAFFGQFNFTAGQAQGGIR